MRALLLMLSLALSSAAFALEPRPPVKVTVTKPPAPKPPVPKPPGPDHQAPPHSPLAKPAKPAPFVKHIESNPVLAARLQTLLPPGLTLEDAALGFHKQGNFIAALHVAHDLNISFADLKAAVIGKPHESLGKAIQELKPGVDAKAEVRKAKFEGKVDVEEAREDSTDNHQVVPLKDSPFIKHLQSNSQLVALLQPLLPPGQTLASAAQGFHNEEQFIAALHAAHNLGIPFAQVKMEMNGRDHDSLAVALFEQKPSADALAEAHKAQTQARTDLSSTHEKP